VLAHPDRAGNPFFLMAPDWALLPLVVLATAATVIASQAVISGAFSMMKQAVRMGLLPRLEILHTSQSQMGQIYLPRVNAILATGVILLVIIFGSSSNLASAYGIAVTGDMVITSLLACVLFVRAWGWSIGRTAAIMVPLLTLEILFLAANGTKIMEGGYVPIMIAATMCLMMWTWVRGTAYVQMRARKGATETGAFIAMLAKSSRLVDVPGTAIFLTSDPEVAPAALMHNIKHNHVLHAQNMIVTVTVATLPYIANADRVTIEPIGERFLKIDLSFGYMEEPNVPKALALARKQGLKFDIMNTSFFLNRRTFRSDPNHGLPAWQEKLFVGLAKSAADVTGFYRLPTNRVVEMGQQLVI
jgi:KUP system potassium uptake protein